MLGSFAVFVVAIAAGAVLTPLVIQLAGAWELYDTPHGDRRVHTQPLPRIGGVAVFAAMGVPLIAIALATAAGFELIVLGELSLVFGMLFGGGIVFATGLVDDLRGLRPMAKLSAQIIAALVVYAYGFRVDVLSFGGETLLSLGWLTLPATLFWVVAVTNGFNLIDGLDGLAAGIAIVALGATIVVAFVLGNYDAAILSLALLGALIGFFRHNTAPAGIFLGDSGSLFIGFMLSVLTIYGSNGSAGAALILVPLFALAIPLLDTLLAVVRRWLRGVPVSQADGRHIHHRLLALGLSHRSAVIVLHGAALALALLGLSLVLAPPPAISSIAAAGGGTALLLLGFGLRRLQYHEFAEAGAVLVSGIMRLRGVVRNQISAQDLLEVLRCMLDIKSLNSALADRATSFGFLHMEVCRESTQKGRPLVLVNGQVARAWKLDYPVMSHDFTEGDDYVLRIWCNPQISAAPHGAERVARSLAPIVEQKLVEFGLGDEGSSRAQIHSRPLGRATPEGVFEDRSLTNTPPAGAG